MRLHRIGRGIVAAMFCLAASIVFAEPPPPALEGTSAEAPAPSTDSEPDPIKKTEGALHAESPEPVQGTVVTGQRGVPLGEAPAAVRLITPTEVRASPGRGTEQVLRTVASIQIPRSDSTLQHPTGQGISMRGTGTGRTLVLLDGVPMNDAFGSWIHWNKLPRTALDRVEVLNGANGNLYGGLAMGGVIQLFRPPPFDDRLRLEAGYGQQDTYQVAADATRKLGESWALSAYANANRSTGVYVVPGELRGPADKPQAFDAHNIGARASWRGAGGATAFGQLAYYGEARDSGTLLSRNSHALLEGSAGLDLGGAGGTWRVRLFGSTQDYRNVNTRLDAARAVELPAMLNRVPSQRLGASVLWSTSRFEHHSVTVGLDAQTQQGTSYEEPFDSSGSSLGQRQAGGRQTLGGLFAEWAWTPLPALTTIASLRGDLWLNHDGRTVSLSGEEAALPNVTDTALNPRVAITYRLIPTLALRGGAYTGFRAPYLNELYRSYFSNGVNFLPNPALGAERLAGGELGVEWTPLPSLRLSSTAYLTELFGLVQSVTVSPTERIRENVARARSGGVEADVSWRLSRALSLGASYAWTDSRLTHNPPQPDLVGKRVARVPTHRAALTGSFRDPRWLDVSVRFYGESSSFADDLNRYTLPAFGMLDASISRRLSETIELYATATNLLNQEVVTDRDATSYRIGPPRTASIGIRVIQ